jgi:hypothetical protein
MIKEAEKEEREVAKKKEIEGLVLQARFEYMQKVNNTMHTKVCQSSLSSHRILQKGM